MRKMKNSGIEWIGEIPDSWRLNKIGQLFNLRNERLVISYMFRYLFRVAALCHKWNR